MHKDYDSWKTTLAECGLLSYSNVEEASDGHISIVITTYASTAPNVSDEKSEEAAFEILLGCEISAI